MFQEVAEERNDLLGGEEPVRLGGEVEAESLRGGRDADAADDGDLVPVSAVGVEDRGLADDRPSPPDDRVEEQAGFVDQNEVSPGVPRFFWMCGQSLATQPAMAASLRWRGRRVGRWGE